MSKFRVGDIVTLAHIAEGAHPQRMTVGGVAGPKVVICDWFVGNHHHRETFDEDGLLLVPPQAFPPPPAGRALHVLQQNVKGFNGGYLRDAARELSRYHTPDGDQSLRHERLSDALEGFLVAIAVNTPVGPERSTAISRALEAKMWASAAVALDAR